MAKCTSSQSFHYSNLFEVVLPEAITINIYGHQPGQIFTNIHFFPSAIKLWNTLSDELINAKTIDEFKKLLSNL